MQRESVVHPYSIKAIVSGRVQGVFFRDSTRKKARQLSLTGHAVNLPNGDVEVLACGDRGAVIELLGWLHQGPEMAFVQRVVHQELTIEAPASFVIG